MIEGPHRTTYSAKERIQSFSDDALVVHGGLRGIGDGIIIQSIDGAVNSSGKHDAVYQDFGTAYGAVVIEYRTQYPKPSLGVRNMLNSGVLPPTISEDLRPIPHEPDAKEIRRRLRINKNPFMSEDEYVKSAAFQKEAVQTEGIIISHVHSDHDGSLGAAKETIPIYASAATQAIQKADQEFLRDNWFYEKVMVNDYVNGIKTNSAGERRFIHAEQETHYTIGDNDAFTARFFPTDHWTGSISNELQFSSGKRLLYTSDLLQGEKTQELIDHLDSNPPYDMAIIDATNVGERMDEMTEETLRGKLTMRFSNNGPFYIFASDHDFKRIQTVLDATKVNDKNLFIPLPIANYLHSMQKQLGHDYTDIPDLSHCSVYLQPSEKNNYMKSGYPQYYKELFDDQSVTFIPQTELHYRSSLAKKAVILFSKVSQLELFDNDNLFRAGGRLLNSTFGLNPVDDIDRSKLRSLNRVLNKSGMSMEKMNALHHMTTKDFTEFVSHLKADTIITLSDHSQTKRRNNKQYVKELIEYHAGKNHKTHVLTDLRPGEPIRLDGRPLQSEIISIAS